ncbi:hypothetical protein [Marinomonas sp. IMCC 4694]|uniref:hypothetical protein n=1 Tax=Marinomonas sp. IMCC 4694 TaxID=2605432 RepID=UPI001652D0E6|nr:hypothetical protein [Marinomonas sp. IMCC 4694]
MPNSLLLHTTVFTPSIQIEVLNGVHLADLAQWQANYQSETVDLRYFFHSGWSS